MEDLALGGLADQFAVDGMDLIGDSFHDLPLGGGGQGDPEAFLQVLQAMERKAAPVL